MKKPVFFAVLAAALYALGLARKAAGAYFASVSPPES